MRKKRLLLLIILMFLVSSGCNQNQNLSSERKEVSSDIIAGTVPNADNSEILEKETVEQGNVVLDENESADNSEKPDIDEFSTAELSCRFDYFRYMGDDMLGPDISQWHFSHSFSNAALSFGQIDDVNDPVFFGYCPEFFYPYDTYYALGFDIPDFVMNMGDAISANKLSELLGTELVSYEGIQAEPGYINWYGRTHIRIEEAEWFYFVYVYDPQTDVQNKNGEILISSEAFIAFVKSPSMNPLGSIDRDCWLDRLDIAFHLTDCPFVGKSYMDEGMETIVYDGILYVTYTDPQTGWEYQCYDFDPSNDSVPENIQITSVTLPAYEIFDDMGDKITYEDFCLNYANLPEEAPDDIMYEDYWRSYPDANFLLFGDIIVYEEIYIGVELDISTNENREILRDSQVVISRNGMFFD